MCTNATGNHRKCVWVCALTEHSGLLDDHKLCVRACAFVCECSLNCNMHGSTSALFLSSCRCRWCSFISFLLDKFIIFLLFCVRVVQPRMADPLISKNKFPFNYFIFIYLWDLSTQQRVCKEKERKYNLIPFISILFVSLHLCILRRTIITSADSVCRTFFFVKKVINRFVLMHSFVAIANIQILVGTFSILRFYTDQTQKSLISFTILFIRSSEQRRPSWFVLLFRYSVQSWKGRG